MKMIEPITLFVDEDLYQRIHNITNAMNEKYNSQGKDLESTDNRILEYLIQTGLSHNSTFKFNLQKFEMDVGLREDFDWEEINS